ASRRTDAHGSQASWRRRRWCGLRNLWKGSGRTALQPGEPGIHRDFPAGIPRWRHGGAIARFHSPVLVEPGSSATQVPSSIHRLYRQRDRGSLQCDGEENRVTSLLCMHGFRDEHRIPRSFGNTSVEPWLTPPHLPRINRNTSIPSACIPRSADGTLFGHMQSDRNFDNYTISELGLKS